MKNCILTILCEGPTEANFASKVLQPYFYLQNIFVKPVILQTSRKKGVHGGLINYRQAINDLERIFASIRPNDSEVYIVTTMFDFYALPNDFAGYAEAMRRNGPRAQVEALEKAFDQEVNRRYFIPYIQLHEFEALLFSDITALTVDYPNAAKEIGKLKCSTDKIGDPELIDNMPETSPSKRIINCLLPKYRYNKVRSGESVALAISLPVIFEKCIHFKAWIDAITNLSQQLKYENE